MLGLPRTPCASESRRASGQAVSGSVALGPLKRTSPMTPTSLALPRLLSGTATVSRKLGMIEEAGTLSEDKTTVKQLVARGAQAGGGGVLFFYVQSALAWGPDSGGSVSSNRWQVQEAEARFPEMLEASLSEGPQIVVAGGKESAVLVPIKQWHRLQRMAEPNIKDLLLAPEARTETLTPPRTKQRSRPPMKIG